MSIYFAVCQIMSHPASRFNMELKAVNLLCNRAKIASDASEHASKVKNPTGVCLELVANGYIDLKAMSLTTATLYFFF